MLNKFYYLQFSKVSDIKIKILSTKMISFLFEIVYQNGAEFQLYTKQLLEIFSYTEKNNCSILEPMENKKGLDRTIKVKA